MSANSSFRRCSVTLISLSSALEGFEGQEHVGHTPPPRSIVVIDTLWLARLGGKRLSHTSANSFGRASRRSRLLLSLFGS
jgi:hypothetical protein